MSLQAEHVLSYPLLFLRLFLLCQTARFYLIFSFYLISKLNFPFIRAETFSWTICCSLFFILSLGCWSFFVALFRLYLGCRGTCFIILPFSISFWCFIVLTSLSLGCKGTFFINIMWVFVFFITFYVIGWPFVFRILHFLFF